MVFFVVGVADKHTAQAVKRQFSIGFGIVYEWALVSWQQLGVVGLVAVQRPGHAPAQRPLLHAGHQRAYGAPFFKPLLEVAGFVELGMQPAGLKGLGVSGQRVALAVLV